MNTLFKKNLREIYKRKVEYFFLIIIIAIGFASYVAINNFMYSREQNFNDLYEESNFATLQVDLEFGEFLTKQEFNRVLSQAQLDEGIDSKEYRVFLNSIVNLQDKSEIGYTRGLVIGYDVENSFDEISVSTPLFYLDSPENIVGEPNKTYLERNFASFYEYEKGENVTFVTNGIEQTYEIAEYINIPEYFSVTREEDFVSSESTFGIIALPIQTIVSQNLINADDIQFNSFALDLQDDENIDLFESTLENELRDIGIQASINQIEENPARTRILDDIQQDKEIFVVFPFLFFFVAALSLFVVLTRVISSQKHEIGLYKALGVKNRSILVYFSIFATIVSLLSILIGFVLSFALAEFFNAILSQIYEFAINNTFFNIEFFFQGVFIVFVVVFFSTFLPAISALRMPPVDALQKREGIARNRINILSRLFSKVSLFSPSVRYSVQYLTRNTTRSAATIVGIASAFVIFIATSFVMTSMFAAIDSAKSSIKWEYQIQLNTFTPTSQVSSLRNQTYNTYPSLLLPTVYKEGNNDLSGSIIAVNPEDFDSIFNFEASLPQQGVLLPNYIKDEFNLRAGDTFTFELPIVDAQRGELFFGEKDLTIAGFFEATIGVNAYASLDYLQSETGLDAQINYFYIENAGENLPASEIQQLINRPYVSSIIASEQNSEQFDSLISSFSSIIYLILAISTVLSFSIVYNMFTLNVADRFREYATMRTLGTSDTRIAKLLFLESLFILFLGAITGIIVGWFVAGLILDTASEAFVGLNIQLQFSLYYSSLAIGIVFISILLVFIISVWRIAHISLAEIIRLRTN